MTTDPQPAQAPRPTEAPSGQPVLESPTLQPAPAAAPEQTAPPPSHALPQHRIKRTRTGGIWVAVGFFAVILLLLLIFILQNSTQVSVSYLGMHGHLPLGVALLLAAVCGVLLVCRHRTHPLALSSIVSPFLARQTRCYACRDSRRENRGGGQPPR